MADESIKNGLSRSDPNRPRVGIVVLNWNGLKDTLECLESLCALDYGNFEVIVYDNGSRDGSPAVIAERFPRVLLLAGERNLGYTGGNNRAMAAALERGAEYVWLLNNDLVLEANALKEIIAESERNPRAGLLSPTIYHYGDREELQFYKYEVDFDNFRLIPRRSLQYHAPVGAGRKPALWGTALLIRREVVQRIGYLNEGYFAYFEDMEYSIRAQRAGFECRTCVAAKVYHKDSMATGSKKAPLQVYLRARNEYFFWMSNTRGFRKVRFFFHYLAEIIGRSFGLKSDRLIESHESCFDGLWDAVKGVAGPVERRTRCPAFLRKAFMWHPYLWVNLFRGRIVSVLSLALQQIRPSLRSG
jgi:GT2 family glycosyltransferase